MFWKKGEIADNQPFYLFLQYLESIYRLQIKCYWSIISLPFIGQKISWKNEKMLVTSIFSFFHDVFKKASSIGGHCKSELCDKE